MKTQRPLVELISYGQNYRQFPPAYTAFDVTELQNPFNEARYKDLSGLDEPTQQFLLSRGGDLLVIKILSVITPLIYKNNALSVAIGCKGGHDRSPAIAELLAKRINSVDAPNAARAHTIHLDVHRRGGR